MIVLKPFKVNSLPLLSLAIVAALLCYLVLYLLPERQLIETYQEHIATLAFSGLLTLSAFQFTAIMFILGHMQKHSESESYLALAKLHLSRDKTNKVTLEQLKYEHIINMKNLMHNSTVLCFIGAFAQLGSFIASYLWFIMLAMFSCFIATFYFGYTLFHMKRNLDRVYDNLVNKS